MQIRHFPLQLQPLSEKVYGVYPLKYSRSKEQPALSLPSMFSQPFPCPPFPGQLFRSSCNKKVWLSTPVEGDYALLTICLLLSQLSRGARTMNLCCGQCLPCDELPGAASSRKSHFVFLHRAVIVSSINVCCTCGREEHSLYLYSNEIVFRGEFTHT